MTQYLLALHRGNAGTGAFVFKTGLPSAESATAARLTKEKA